MAKINVESGGTILSTGLLQLSGGAAMSTTLRSVTDQNNTASQLKLATNLTQVAGTLQIALDGGSYIDAQDVSGIDRFNVNRSAGSQQVNVDFSSNPTSGTDAVGALRTYANGVALSEAMTFLRNGNVGINTNSSQDKLDVNGAIRIRSNTPNLTAVSDNAVIDYVPTSIFATAPCIRLSAIGTASVGADVRFQTGTNSSVSEKMRITSGGNVGIGTTTPSQPLQVNGNIQGTNLISTSNVACGNVLYNNNFYCESSGNTNIGGGQAPATARLQVKGSGSTSATTSLLVQNSAASNLLSVLDDGRLTNFGDFYLGSGSAGGSSVFQNAGNTLNLSADNNHDVGYTQIKARRTAAGGGVRIENTNFPSNPDNSAQLDVASTTKGFLPPRMTNAQRLAIVTPAVGLMVYCTDAVEGLYIYKSTGWTFVI